MEVNEINFLRENNKYLNYTLDITAGLYKSWRKKSQKCEKNSNICKKNNMTLLTFNIY